MTHNVTHAVVAAKLKRAASQSGDTIVSGFILDYVEFLDDLMHQINGATEAAVSAVHQKDD